MPALHPRGVNHLAISTTDMGRQLRFWCDAVGTSLKALYWMHGVKGAYHGFVELDAGSYIATSTSAPGWTPRSSGCAGSPPTSSGT